MLIQLEFDSIGLNEVELDQYCLKKQIALLEKQLGNVRRGLFRRHGELEKEMVKLKEEVIDLQMKLKELTNEDVEQTE
jgi:hypothetical protein